MDINESLFWAKVEKTATCWNWTACKIPKGYGYFAVNRHPRYAHRLSWEMVNGPIPERGQIDHTCHNTSCVNPAHLRLTTPKQNGEHRGGAQTNSKSGVRGVSWHKASKKWRAVINHNGAHIHVGYFSTIDLAEAAVIAKRNEFFTHNDKDRRAA